jgi:hypothetical protein
MNEFNLMSRAEKIAWCEARLRHYDHMDADIRQAPHDPYYAQRMHQVEVARRQMLEALRTVQRPTLWRRINMYVNHQGAKDAVKEDARRRRQPCPGCGGSGRVVGAGNYFEPCGSCGGYMQYRGSAEIAAAHAAAEQLRRQTGA